MKSKIYLLLILGLLFQMNAKAQFPEQYKTMLMEEWKNNSWRNDTKMTNDYDSKGKLVKQTTTAWDTVKNIWKNYYMYSSEYDNNGNLIKRTSSQWDTIKNVWQDYSVTTNILNADGTVKESLSKMWEKDENKWIDYQKTAYTYDAAKNILTETVQMDMGLGWMNFSKYTFTYNTSNKLTKELYQSFNFMTMGLVDKSQTTYEYDTDGNEYRSTEQTKAEASGTWLNYSRSTNTYTTVNNKKMVSTVLEEVFENEWINDWKDTYSYNNDGTIKDNLSEEWNTELKTWENYSKDMVTYSNGKMYQIVSQDWNKTGSKWDNDSRITFGYLGTGIDPQISEADDLVRVYPNPFTDVVNIENEGSLNGRYNLYNTNGQIVHSANADKTRMRLNLNSLEKGTYFLKTMTVKGEQVIKLIKIE